MYLKKIDLLNFKNIEDKSFEFNAKINCFIGLNGVGKTNILDAIYYIAYGRSYFNPIAVQNIKHGADFFVIDGLFEKNEQSEHILCSLKKGQKKILKRNNKNYERFSDHFGFIPLVIISPSDSDLIIEGSETRRKFLDSVISQMNSNYLQLLIQHQKLITQRNALLKSFVSNNYFDRDTLEIYNEQIETIAQPIYETRRDFLHEFIPIFNQYHQLITGNKDDVHLLYESQLEHHSMRELFDQNIQKDRALQYTSVGIHKDDLVFLLKGSPIKKFGSQGQQKSFLIALKLAQFDFLKKQHNIAPILLFDDIFDKLDELRVRQILELVNLDTFGQMFITDTHLDRTESLLNSINQDFKIFTIE
ncbi:DNA replication/repair protein RecF [Myroides odoratus]|uniref:DNA replication and repair protein RecF n=1 Tax=Myroides odoratus TaxID=256 RepID=A0A378U4I1_MYROD|nr:DNA replication and repair protein RecF [Myroides odoratus]MDH6601507.1 DNA replication and repair protein RecF [Myroides gitamensis]EHQ43336.1 DNA replication and repair protein RecF [Myroides odoratus DSM 2801]EKB06723.1 DNA replication and repair protein RecF [Myroides odoratus CIP 103059]MCS4240334.1 DNA replication and repair protein RecF [Myroides odoratus]MDR0224695.1 DNA replication and repair protein RecF [Myroides odoratus]